MPSAAEARTPPVFPAPALALAGFAVWTVFSLLPGLTRASGAFRIREAWDTGAFWLIGAPLLLVAQGIAGSCDGAKIFRDPLYTLGGLFAGMLLIHPAGNDLGLLPLAMIFIGVPSYAGLLGVAAIGRVMGGRMRKER
jgi:hypothetical protein